jgi:hypothetical protein
MRIRFLTMMLAGGLTLGGMAFADPPIHAHGADLPPGLAMRRRYGSAASSCHRNTGRSGLTTGRAMTCVPPRQDTAGSALIGMSI